MSTNYPDNWVVIEINSEQYGKQHKILAGWYGGYAYGDSWKLNSGIVKIDTDENGMYHIYGYSGSKYMLNPKAEKFSGITAGIYQNYHDTAEKNGVKFEVVDLKDILDQYNV